jgi:hypothetical protein
MPFFRARPVGLVVVPKTTDLAIFDCSARKDLGSAGACGAGAAGADSLDEEKPSRVKICPEANFVVLLMTLPSHRRGTRTVTFFSTVFSYPRTRFL